MVLSVRRIAQTQQMLLIYLGFICLEKAPERQQWPGVENVWVLDLGWHGLEVCLCLSLGVKSSLGISFLSTLVSPSENRHKPNTFAELVQQLNIMKFYGMYTCQLDPFQYSCLEENPTDREVWWTTVHGGSKSWAQLSNQHY